MFAAIRSFFFVPHLLLRRFGELLLLFGYCCCWCWWLICSYIQIHQLILQLNHPYQIRFYDCVRARFFVLSFFCFVLLIHLVFPLLLLCACFLVNGYRCFETPMLNICISTTKLTLIASDHMVWAYTQSVYFHQLSIRNLSNLVLMRARLNDTHTHTRLLTHSKQNKQTNKHTQFIFHFQINWPAWCQMQFADANFTYHFNQSQIYQLTNHRRASYVYVCKREGEKLVHICLSVLIHNSKWNFHSDRLAALNGRRSRTNETCKCKHWCIISCN